MVVSAPVGVSDLGLCNSLKRGVIKWYQLQLSSKNAKFRLTKDGAIFRNLRTMGCGLDGSKTESRYPRNDG